MDIETLNTLVQGQGFANAMLVAACYFLYRRVLSEIAERREAWKTFNEYSTKQTEANLKIAVVLQEFTDVINELKNVISQKIK